MSDSADPVSPCATPRLLSRRQLLRAGASLGALVVLGALPAEAGGATLPALTASQLTAAIAGLPKSGTVKLPGGGTAKAADLRAAAAAFAVGDAATPDPLTNPVAALGVLVALAAWAERNGTLDLSGTLPRLSAGQSTEPFGSAIPPAVVVRPKAALVLVGTLSGHRILAALEDPVRQVAGHPPLELVALRSVDLTSLLAVLHAKLDSTGTVILLPSGSKVPLRPVASALATRLLAAAGVLFVDPVPIQPPAASSPLLTTEPIVPAPPSSVVPGHSRITQASDGRVLALDAGGTPVGRAAQLGDTWQWVGPDEAAGLDYFLRELADGLGIRIGVTPDSTHLADNGYAYQRAVLDYSNHLEISVVWTDFEATRDEFTFGATHELVALAKSHCMSTQSYLIWASQLPRWLTGEHLTTAQLRGLVADYIRTAMGHYKGKIDAWQVFNEPVSGPMYGATTIEHFWADTFGSGYYNLIRDCLVWVRSADSHATLLVTDNYNDGRNHEVTAGFLQLVQQLQSDGAPIDGVGVETHLRYADDGINTAFSPTLFADTLARYQALGLQVYVTEFDVDMTGFVGTKDEEKGWQAGYYRDYLQAALDAGVKNFTIFGLTDSTSWYNLTGEPHTDALMLNGDCTPKPAYFAVADVLKAELRKRGRTG